MARRRGGGGRQERTKSPASGGGVHRRAQQRGAPGAAQRAGLHPVVAGLQGRDAPRHPGAEADAAAQPKRGDNRRAAKADRQDRPARPDPASAIVPAMPTRRHSRLGWSAAEGERGQAETA